MTKEDLILILQTVLDTLKDSNSEKQTTPVEQQTQTVEKQVQQVQEQLQPPATSWDILRQNQQQLALLQQEVSNLKLAKAVGTGIPQMGQYGTQPIINPINIGGSI